jgi:hypothetical protein
VAIVLAVSPECLSGPYGTLSPELQAVWLANIVEAQPIHLFAIREPVGAIALFGPPAVALLVALRRALRMDGSAARWALAAALLVVPLALSFHQVRTLPSANAVAIAVLAAWFAEIAAACAPAGGRWRRARALVLPALLSLPVAHLALGWTTIRAVETASGGRIAPARLPIEENAWAAGLPRLEADCQDEASAALLASVPRGTVLAPVFYGPTVIALSEHSAVAGPYHREGPAILDAINAMRLTPEAARAAFAARNVDYLAICSTDRGSAKARVELAGGLQARLLAGERVAWLEPVPAVAGTKLLLWRVAATVALRP